MTLIPGWLYLFYLVHSMTDDNQIKGFDPFAILGVTPNTPAKDIKKQYRALSLIYHPDKVRERCFPVQTYLVPFPVWFEGFESS